MNDAKEEIRAKLAIEDVIGEYVQLKRAGRYWRGLSPFTNEKTPSFFVTPERDIWHDFSSNQGGDVFSFIELVEGVGFREALEILARKAGVDLSQFDSRQPRDLAARKARILEMNNFAKNYWQREMTKNKTAMEYIFAKRKLSREIVLEWGIGFAPENSQLKNLLLARKFQEKEIREAGLIGGRGGEMFRSRMMIPLRDGQGQIVGFTGRIIGDGEPKYLNTPGTILYDKGRQVFGLNFAKTAIRENDFAVIVEGNLDVISSHQAGVKNVVACAGTALTRDHLKSLARLSRKVNLCFDADRAGVAATERAIILAQPLELKLGVISWDQAIAKDPDELISRDVELWKTAIKQAVPAVEWVIREYARRENLASADGKKNLTSAALKLIRELSDAVEQEFYVREVAEITGINVETLMKKMSREKVENASFSRKHLREIKAPRREYSRQNEKYFVNMIFAICYKFSRLRSILANLPDEYLSETLAKIKYFLLGREIKSREKDSLKIEMKNDVSRVDEARLLRSARDDDEEVSRKIEITPEMADKMAELELIAEKEIRESDDERILLLANMLELEKLKLRAKFESLNAELANVLEGDSEDARSELTEEGDSRKRVNEEGNSREVERAKILNGAVNGLKKDLNLLEKTSARDDFAGLREIWEKRREN